MAWDRVFQTPLTAETWDTIYEYARKCSLNVAIQENGYKIAARWYRTPSWLHKFSPSVPNTCWRCRRQEGTMLHIWWDCERLQPFWREVSVIISHVTTYTLDYTPAQFLLHHTSLSKKKYYKSLAMHMVNAARLCVPIHWRSTHTPTIGEWFRRISKIKEMEELIHIVQERTHKFLFTWSCSIHFMTTERYRQHVL